MILVVRYLKNLINPCRSWFPWSRRILNPSNFRNKSSLNRNWVLRVRQQKKLECTRKRKPESDSDYWLSTTFSSLSTGMPVYRQQVCQFVDRLSYLLFVPLCRQPIGCITFFFFFRSSFFSNSIESSLAIISNLKTRQISNSSRPSTDFL